MRHFVLLLCIALIFSCCRKNISQNQIAGTSGSEYFPNTIGDHWKYKYVDSLNNNVISFVDVDIVGIKSLSNGQAAKIWTLNFTNYVDTNYVYQIKDTVRFLNAYLEIVNTYVVPLVINNKWENSFLSDSIQVNAQQTFIFA
jgi:hypothetical protein